MTTQNNKKNYVLYASITSLLSIFNFIYLSFAHYNTKFGLSESKSFCNINEVFNCDLVSLSSYSVLLGAPVSNWGIAFSAVLLMILIFSNIGFVRNPDQFLRFGFWLSTLGLMASVVMGSISLVLLKSYCLFCIFAYILSLITWFLLKFSFAEPPFKMLASDIKSLFTSSRPTLFLMLLIPAVSILSHRMVLDSIGLIDFQKIADRSLESWKSNTERNFNFDGSLNHKSTTAHPKMVIVEFADFLCPHCKAAAEPLHNFALSRSDVWLTFKPFPLDGNCNESIGQKVDDNIRCKLAYSVLCAEKLKNAGWKAYLSIFANQSNWRGPSFDSEIKKIIEPLGINDQEFKKCIESDEIYKSVLSQAKEAQGIMGTPTVFVNGRELPRGQLIPILESAYSAL